MYIINIRNFVYRVDRYFLVLVKTLIENQKNIRAFEPLAIAQAMRPSGRPRQGAGRSGCHCAR